MSDLTDFFPTPSGGLVTPGGIAARILIVAGGGTGNNAPGGGAGGLMETGVTLIKDSLYGVVIGEATTVGAQKGEDSQINGPGLGGSLRVIGGGPGNYNAAGGDGGSGGGTSSGSLSGGNAEPGQFNTFAGFPSVPANPSGLGNGSGGGGAGGPGKADGNGGNGLITNIISAANATNAAVGEVISNEVWFAGGGGKNSSLNGKGQGTNSGGGGHRYDGTGDAGVCIILLQTTDFTGTTFKTYGDIAITPGPSAEVQTFTEGDNTVVVFRSSATMKLI